MRRSLGIEILDARNHFEGIARHERLEHVRILAVTLEEVHADYCMRAFYLMVHCLADVVQQSTTLRFLDVQAELAGQTILIDATNGNLPFTFLSSADAQRRIRGGMRARMVYRTERLKLAEASNLAGDIMLTVSEFHVPDLHFQFMFDHGLGLHISAAAYLGVFFDWGGERSRLMQNYYSRAARRRRMPFPRFVHEANLLSVPDENLRQLLERVLHALRAQYQRREYTGDFTFVIQPLTSDRWIRPHVSAAISRLLWPEGETA